MTDPNLAEYKRRLREVIRFGFKEGGDTVHTQRVAAAMSRLSEDDWDDAISAMIWDMHHRGMLPDGVTYRPQRRVREQP